jgi:hypothetical protein
MSAASKDALELLHDAVAKELTERVKNGDATAADISNAIKFLKDNGIEAVLGKNPGVTSLASQFPTFDDERNSRRPLRPEGSPALPRSPRTDPPSSH